MIDPATNTTAVRLTRRIGNQPAGTIRHLDSRSAAWLVQRNQAVWATEPTTTPEPAPEPKPDLTPTRPPTAGPGSGRRAWQLYATHIGHDDPPGATRHDIIHLVDGV